MWATCGSAYVTATLPLLWRVKDTSLDVKGEPWQALHSHNIPAVLLTGVSRTLRTLFCQRLNKHIRLIVAVCNRDWEVTPSLNPKVNQNSMWTFKLSSQCNLMSVCVCVCGLHIVSWMNLNAGHHHKHVNAVWHVNPSLKIFFHVSHPRLV